MIYLVDIRYCDISCWYSTKRYSLLIFDIVIYLDEIRHCDISLLFSTTAIVLKKIFIPQMFHYRHLSHAMILRSNELFCFHLMVLCWNLISASSIHNSSTSALRPILIRTMESIQSGVCWFTCNWHLCQSATNVRNPLVRSFILWSFWSYCPTFVWDVVISVWNWKGWTSSHVF